MSRKHERRAREAREEGAKESAPPTGYIRAADPDTGADEQMPYWLPDGVTLARDAGSAP